MDVEKIEKIDNAIRLLEEGLLLLEEGLLEDGYIGDRIVEAIEILEDFKSHLRNGHENN